LTLDGYCTKKVKMIIAIAKEVLNRKISLFKAKLNIAPMKKLAIIFGAFLYVAQRLGH
jgi:hypothetical protein